MSLVRLLVSAIPEAGETLVPALAQGHHLVRVRRKAAGDRVVLQTPGGQRALGEVLSAQGDSVLIRCLERLPEVAGVLPVKLYPALLPDSAFTLLLQKATEVGVREVAPVMTEFTVAKVGDLGKKLARWQKVCDEAACQCGGVPARVLEPVSFQTAIAEPFAGRRLLADASGVPLCELPGLSAQEAPFGAALLIGPEGGHSVREMEAAEAAGWTRTAFHPFIMRAETAAVVCAALLQQRFGGLA